MSVKAFAFAALLNAQLFTQPAFSGEDCETVSSNVEDAVEISTEVLKARLTAVTKTKPDPADDKAKASIKNSFCSASGEFLGISRAYRAVAAECLKGNKRRDTLASLDKSLKQLRDSIRETCE